MFKKDEKVFLSYAKRPTKRVPWILDSLESVQYQGPSKTGRHCWPLERVARCLGSEKPRHL